MHYKHNLFMVSTNAGTKLFLYFKLRFREEILIGNLMKSKEPRNREKSKKRLEKRLDSAIITSVLQKKDTTGQHQNY